MLRSALDAAIADHKKQVCDLVHRAEANLTSAQFVLSTMAELAQIKESAEINLALGNPEEPEQTIRSFRREAARLKERVRAVMTGYIQNPFRSNKLLGEQIQAALEHHEPQSRGHLAVYENHAAEAARVNAAGRRDEAW